jgi:hypothetical protein
MKNRRKLSLWSSFVGQVGINLIGPIFKCEMELIKKSKLQPQLVTSCLAAVECISRQEK